jgi:putative transposase
MSSKYKFRDQTKAYFISFAVVYWIDVFIRNEYRDIILNSLKICQSKKGLEIYGWCIMSSHMHMIIGTHGEKMEDIIRDFKTFTSRSLKEAIKNHPQESRKEWMLWMMEKAGKANSNNKNFQFWQQDNHPIELFDNQIMQQKLDYIHDNPVASGIVERAEDYLYSSAGDYAGRRGLLEIMFID